MHWESWMWARASFDLTLIINPVITFSWDFCQSLDDHWSWFCQNLKSVVSILISFRWGLMTDVIITFSDTFSENNQILRLIPNPHQNAPNRPPGEHIRAARRTPKVTCRVWIKVQRLYTRRVVRTSGNCESVLVIMNVIGSDIWPQFNHQLCH